MSTQENVQIVKGFFAAAGRGDKQVLLALSAEHIKWIEDSGFLDDVLRGLSGYRRSVPCRWLYDDRGSELFEEITRVEECWTGESLHTESSRKYNAQSLTRLAKRGGWDVAELWTDADRLFAVFGLVAAEPVQGS